MARRSSSAPRAKATKAKKPLDLSKVEPREFFESYLVEQYALGLTRSPAPPDYHLTVRVKLTGAGGGLWDLRFGASALKVSRKPSGESPDAHVVQSAADWKALVRGDLGGPAAALADARLEPAPLLPLDAASRERLGRLRGTLAFVVRHFQDRDWRIAFHFGPGPAREPADTVFSMGALDFESLGRRGPVPNIQSLMLGGALRVEGNFALAGELAAIAAAHAQATFAAM